MFYSIDMHLVELCICLICWHALQTYSVMQSKETLPYDWELHIKVIELYNAAVRLYAQPHNYFTATLRGSK